VRDLPRQLTVEELAELFEGRTRFVVRLAELEDPLGRAREVAATLSDEEKKEVLDAHPPIGAKQEGLSTRSAAEQGSDETDPALLGELGELNRRYEEKFGFRFVVFVNRRPKSEIVPILRERLDRTREQELATALGELVSIAEDRWRQS
jgi:2-oxo-4-hydroxy-4-carboxy--5-ureidoimidazoline (OHCU) decarboxylase